MMEVLESFQNLIGKPITVWCVNYIYAGILSSVNEHDIKLTDACVVYETGPLHEKGFKDSQRLPNDLYVRTASIESYGEQC
jgi:hypothetical protein